MPTLRSIDTCARRVSSQSRALLPCLLLLALGVQTLIFITQRTKAAPGHSINDSSLSASSSNHHKQGEFDKSRVSGEYGKLPLQFEANGGQANRDVKFLARGSGYDLFLMANEAVLSLKESSLKKNREDAVVSGRNKPAQRAVLRMKLFGSNDAPQVSGEEESGGRVNYYIGNHPSEWHVNIPTYGKIRYQNVYPGIDAIYYGNRQQIENDFVVAPGADPNRIRLAFYGAQKIHSDERGDLVLQTKGGDVRLRKPVVFQEINGVKKEVASRYQMKGMTQVGFKVAPYDQSLPLIIDPVLSSSTYLGGNGKDVINSIAVDASGNAYVTGSTTSLNFPTANPFQSSTNNQYSNEHAFVAKLNPTGTALLYSTYLSGNSFDQGIAIAVNANGNAYVAGTTYSTNFPVTAGAFQTTGGNSNESFIAKFNESGSALIYSTYLGNAFVQGMTIDSAGNAYVTGSTDSPNLPVTAGAFQPTIHGSNGLADAFATKLNPEGTALIYSTYLGGGITDIGHGIAVDQTGNAYVTGLTNSRDFPIIGGFQTTYAGYFDVFVAKLNAAGSGLLYSSYLGGGTDDVGNGITVDSGGNAYVTGYANSSNFRTKGAFQPISGGTDDAFVVKFNTLATGEASLVYSTFLGGNNTDQGTSIAIDNAGSVYVTGITKSSNFPTTVDAFQRTFGGGTVFLTAHTFFVKLNSSGDSLQYSTYFGGNADDKAKSIAVDFAGNGYIAGSTTSTTLPTAAPLQSANGGGQNDSFIAKFSGLSQNPTPTPIPSPAPSPPTGQPPVGRLAFQSGQNKSEIYVMNGDGSSPTRITTNGNSTYDGSSTWSPDGTRIAFARNGDLYIVNSDGSNLQRITGTGANESQPAWSPDGTKIAFVIDFDIYVMNADGSNGTQKRLTNDFPGDFEPAWSPDGTKIAFGSERDGNFEIYVMNSDDGSGLTRLTNNPASDVSPAWSPDGSRIAFASNRSGKGQIYVMNADGSGVTNFSNNDAEDFEPAWSPDGSRLAFTSTRDSNNEIYTMNADGSGQTNLTHNSVSDSGAAWQPSSNAPSPLPTTIQFSASRFSASESSSNVQITVTRLGNISGTAAVDYATYDGTAKQQRDYTLASGTLNFAAGESSKTFTVLVTDNAYIDGTRSLNLILSNPGGGATLNTQSAATLLILDNDTVPPSGNPIDSAPMFVRQQYSDFLNRAPDAGGFAYWTSLITSCNSDPQCINSRRVSVSAAFFIEQEFQKTGSYVYRMYKATFGQRPSYAQFMPDRARINPDASHIEASKQQFANLFVQRPEFLSRYPSTMAPDVFIEQLIATVKTETSGAVDLASQRAVLLSTLQQSGRGSAVQQVVENSAFQAAEFNKAFVTMQYFGYLRRDPEDGGFNFWLDVLNNRVANNYRGMVCAFITSAEYQDRFSSVRTRNDSTCGSIEQ